jgi:hypothetical protein
VGRLFGDVCLEINILGVLRRTDEVNSGHRVKLTLTPSSQSTSDCAPHTHASSRTLTAAPRLAPWTVRPLRPTYFRNRILSPHIQYTMSVYVRSILICIALLGGLLPVWAGSRENQFMVSDVRPCCLLSHPASYFLLTISLLSLCLSVSVCLCLSLSVSLCLSVTLCLPLYLSISPPSLYIYIYIYIYLSRNLSLYLSLYISTSLYLYLPPSTSYLSQSPSVSLQTTPNLLRFNRQGSLVSSNWADYTKWDCTGEGNDR